ncbi:MAG: hypothetical protein CSA26_02105 [Desulfobacterales bacterium]|nr:MAG: hypothetical protein CSA26_02105 [Desulfobacterales bacterium]
MLELREVTKMYNGQPIIDRLSIKIAANEVTGLLGPSGCGKSTILKIFAGLVQPDAGTVKRGSDCIGFVFQEHRLIPWKTVAENVCFSLRASGLSKKEALHQARQILEKVELAACINQYPSQLSGGMCQRVSIARALAIKPDILLLDEPFSSLDLELKNNLLVFLRSIVREHPDMTILYVTHAPSELTGLARFIYQMSSGGQLKKTSAARAW